MSIEWLRDVPELEDRLMRDFPLAGLVLRSFASGRLEDPSALLTKLPQADVAIIDGLGDFDAWGGYSDGVPFSLYAANRPAGWTFTVHVATKLNEWGGLDSSLLSVLSDLPSELTAIDSLYLENVPFDGPAYGVFRLGVREPDFKCPRLHDAIRWQRALDQLQPAGRYVADAPRAAPTWIALGSSVGPFVHDIHHFDSRETAEQFIQRRISRGENKGSYTLHYGRIVAHP